jgi:transposase-like protein
MSNFLGFFMSKHGEAFKRQLIENYLSRQSGTEAAAQRHDIDRGIVRKWVAAYRLHGAAEDDPRRCQSLRCPRRHGQMIEHVAAKSSAR